MKKQNHIECININIQHSHVLLFYGLLLIFIFEYLRPNSYLPILDTFKMNTAIPVAVFTLSLITGGGPKLLYILNASNTKWLIFFLSLIVLSAMTADVTFYVYVKFMAVLGYIILYFTIIKIITTEKRLAMLFGLLVTMHLLLLILNPDVVLKPESRHYLGGVTFLGDGNDFALSLCIVIPFAIYLFQRAECKLKKYIIMSILAVLIFAVIATQSRGGFLSLAMVFIYFWLNSEKKLHTLIATVIITGFVALFTPVEFYERMESIARYEEDGSAKGRIMAWNSAIRMALDNPITGVGAGHFAVEFGVNYRPPGMGRTDMPWLNAHSIYFLTLGEFGIPGIIFLLGIIIFNIKRGNKAIRILKENRSDNMANPIKLAIAMNTSMIGFAVGGAFLSALYYPHLYVLAALHECMKFIYSKNRASINMKEKKIY